MSINNFYKSLLHLVDEAHLNNLDVPLMEMYKKEWISGLKSGNKILTEQFNDQDALMVSISELSQYTEAQVALFSNKRLLAFCEEGIVDEKVVNDIRSILEEHHNPWTTNIIKGAFVNNYILRLNNRGVKHLREIPKINIICNSLNPKFQEKIEKSALRKIRIQLDHLHEEDLESVKRSVSPHFHNALRKLPFDIFKIELYYGKVLIDYVEKKLSNATQSKFSDKGETEILYHAAHISSEILDDKPMRTIASKLKKKLFPSTEKKFKLSHVIGILVLIIIGFFGMQKVIGIIKSETLSDEEKYDNYLNKVDDYNRNRMLSKEIIDQRRVTEITESFQYGEKEGVPLFHTYLKTNKYLNINEVDNELYKLKQFINTDGIDTEKIYTVVHFFILDKEKPYRSVTAEYSNINKQVKYKQILKTRATGRFEVSPTSYKEPWRMTLELTEKFPSGILQQYVYEMHIRPSEDRVEVYTYDPMPSLTKNYTIEEFQNNTYSLKEINEDYIARIGYRILSILDGEKMKYRIPIHKLELEYIPQVVDFNGMYNWELTTSDDYAFVRLRDEKISGYYLINRQSGNIFQAKVTFPGEDKMVSEYFIQLDKLEN